MADIKGILVVKNVGSAPSPNCSLDIVFEETKTHRKGSNRIPVPSLNSGETYSITTTLIRLPEGDYKLCAFVDSTNVIPEFTEANNTACRNLRVR